MTSVVATAAEKAAMAALRTGLADLGYQQVYGPVVGGELFATDPASAARRAAALPGPESAAMRLLALGGAVDAEALPGSLAGALPLLVEAGLARRLDHGRWETDGWVVVPLRGGWLITDRPWSYGADEVRVYLGPDSLRLAAGLPVASSLRVLDLGAGCGVQGLLAVRRPAEVVLLDVEPRAVRLAALNALLNEVPFPVRSVQGDLFEPVAGECFDLIVCLPPYVPVPRGLALSGVANGGPDGLAFLRRLLPSVAEHLRPGGELAAFCQLLCDDGGPLLARELAALAPGLEARLTVAEERPAAAFAAQLAGELSRRGAGSGPALAATYREAFAALGVGEVGNAFLRLRRPAVSRVPPGATGAGTDAHLLRTGRPWRRTDVPRPISGVRAVPGPRWFETSTQAGPGPLVDAVAAGLLGACDGRRTVAEAVDAAWPEAAAEARALLLEQALERCASMEGAGLVGRQAPEGPEAPPGSRRLRS